MIFGMKKGKRALAAASVLTAAALAFTGCAPAEPEGPVTITLLIDNTETSIKTAELQIAAFEAANENIKVELETRPGGADGDNIIKTKLATGEMNDVFFYNSGSLFQAINPDQNLVDLSNEEWADRVVDSFWPTVSTANGKYGAPYGTAMGGGILYNKKVYADLGLSVPKTWDEFMANNAKIKAAGIIPVMQTYGDTWTSQLFVLGDYHNVQAVEPNFAADYTANKAKYATSAAASKGFDRLEELNKAGYYNSDYASALFADGVVRLGKGEAAHFPMLTFAVSTLDGTNPELSENIGFFAQPGDDAATNGLTVWMPSGMYIPKTTEGAKLEAAKKFLAFQLSTEGLQIYIDVNGQTGPFLVSDAPAAAELLSGYADLFPYFETEGATTPALEFLSPIKGPSLEQLTVAVGTGQYTAKEAAALYDEDVKKQAQQLGLEGW